MYGWVDFLPGALLQVYGRPDIYGKYVPLRFGKLQK